MKIKELLMYEAPTITEFISWNWLQNIIAKYLANKVSKKVKRYNQRLKRQNRFKQFNHSK